MAGGELQQEHLIVLPLRLETITVSGGAVTQPAGIEQSAWNNQTGGVCIHSNCTQVNVQVNVAVVNQDAVSSATVSDVIDDDRQIFQSFLFG
ncbi:MAG TPA: hypothetical protein VFS96_00250 [Nitrolancea sp.]|nr:hypothetical protein [Nitrolancea sp.]